MNSVRKGSQKEKLIKSDNKLRKQSFFLYTFLPSTEWIQRSLCNTSNVLVELAFCYF